MATFVLLLVFASFGLAQVLMARRSRRYSRILEADDFLFQRRRLAQGVRRNSAMLMMIGLLSSIGPLALAFHSEAQASPRMASRHGAEQPPLHLAESLACVPSSPRDGVCS